MRLLEERPPKDGMNTEYACGFEAYGTWNTRLILHRQFINSKIGKYILLLESKNKVK